MSLIFPQTNPINKADLDTPPPLPPENGVHILNISWFGGLHSAWNFISGAIEGRIFNQKKGATLCVSHLRSFMSASRFFACWRKRDKTSFSIVMELSLNHCSFNRNRRWYLTLVSGHYAHACQYDVIVTLVRYLPSLPRTTEKIFNLWELVLARQRAASIYINTRSR